jgi:AcrR family transcriptional regulator
MRDAEKDAIEMSARRARLLEAGFRLMSARTIEAVKLSEIANEAGIGIATLYRYFKTKPALVIEIGTVLWKKYYVEVEKAYAARGGAEMNAAEEMEFFLDSIIELYRSHKDVLRFNRNFDTYVKHQECTAEQMRPYNEAVEVFAHKFHVVYEKAMKDGTLDIRVSEKRLFVGTLYAVLSVAGKFAEGLVYPPDGEHDMTEELLMLKRMIVDSMRKKRKTTL